jgi:MATE family multidrug resistance protein
MGAGFLLLPSLLASVYTRDASVLALSIILIRIAGVFQIFDGLQVVSTGILRGAGDTRVPAAAGLVGYWLIGMPISLGLGFGLERGAAGLWWGLVAGLGTVALFLLARVFQKLTRQLARVVIDSETARSDRAAAAPAAVAGAAGLAEAPKRAWSLDSNR